MLVPSRSVATSTGTVVAAGVSSPSSDKMPEGTDCAERAPVESRAKSANESGLKVELLIRVIVFCVVFVFCPFAKVIMVDLVV